MTLTETGARVIALDVSLSSLQVSRLRTAGQALPVSANMEQVPLGDSAVDVVVCAGSLSYGEPSVVNAEVFRILRPGGSLIMVDSLDHGPVYRLNRWVQYLRGARTASTLRRMPTLARVASLIEPFEEYSFFTHGSYLFLQPALKRILGSDRALRVDSELESRWPSRRNAFKFVLWARGFHGRSQAETQATQ